MCRRSCSYRCDNHLISKELCSFPTRRSSDLGLGVLGEEEVGNDQDGELIFFRQVEGLNGSPVTIRGVKISADRKSTRLNYSHVAISYAVFCLKKKITEVRTSLSEKKFEL